VLAEYDLADQAYSLNDSSPTGAKRQLSPQRNPDLSLGQWGQRRNSLGHIDALTDDEGVLREQATGLYDGGVDLFIVVRMCCKSRQQANAIEEVQQQGKASHNGSVTMETTGTMLVGSDISAVLTILSPPHRHPRT